MIDFLFSLPLWALAVVLNVWLIGFSLVSLWALRRWVLPRLHINTNASLFYCAAVMQSAIRALRIGRRPDCCQRMEQALAGVRYRVRRGNRHREPLA